MKIRVLLADDHKRFRTALRRMLETDPKIEVVAEVENGNEVIECAARLLPDVVCMDFRMPGLDGIEATRRLSMQCPDVKIIGLSANAETHFALKMQDAGAAGYVTKSDVGNDLIHVIRRALQDQPRPADLQPGTTNEADGQRATMSAGADLTSREREILQLLVAGRSEHEIADGMALSLQMVSVHLRNAMRKLSVASVTDLARAAAQILS
jgi:DNA-binding NarL/FixJ family response regulator